MRIMDTNFGKTHRLLAPFMLLATLLLGACSGGSGSGTESNNNLNAGAQSNVYNGPAPQTADVQSFKINVWDNLSTNNRCGSCHGTGGQAPSFVRSDDINLAYNAALGITDFVTPQLSRMVTKVGGGHNCWLTSDQACADIITTYIEAWVQAVNGGGATVIALTPPVIRPIGDTKRYPADSTGFATHVYPVLRGTAGCTGCAPPNCANCHSEDSILPAPPPFFASNSPDVAYSLAQSRMDLNNPGNSAMVLRLRSGHNCWNGASSCAADAQELEDAIAAYANTITADGIDTNVVVASMALTLPDGVVASSGGRHETNVIAQYEFKTGQGTTAFDTSGVNPALDLQISGNVEWVGGWGIRILDGKAQATTGASNKLYDRLRASGEYSIEGWVAPANVTQEGPASIIAYSGGNAGGQVAKNFALGQTLYNYDFLARSTVTNAEGNPSLSTADAAEVLQATLQHVVVTFDPVNGRRIYVNGQWTGDVDAQGGGSLTDWDNTYALVMGNEISNDRLWQGTIRMVAIHDRALTPDQILQNFNVGVGEKYYLLFSVAHVVNILDAYVVFEVSQYDSYSYLFREPFFVILDDTVQPGTIPVRGMRLGINGREVQVGQAWTNLDMTITDATYLPGGQAISPLGTIIALENGPVADEFFLTFEQLGSETNVYVEATPPPAPGRGDLPAESDIGLRNFAEINATMSKMTGVLTTQSDVRDVYNTVIQQLPTVETIGAFISSHQMGVTQLAIEYCDVLVNTNPGYFSSFNALGGFGQPAETALAAASAGRTAVINDIVNNIVTTGLIPERVPAEPATPAFEAEVGAELDALIGRMVPCSGTCSGDHTAVTVKAACAAAIGSAVTLVQ